MCIAILINNLHDGSKTGSRLEPYVVGNSRSCAVTVDD